MKREFNKPELERVELVSQAIFCLFSWYDGVISDTENSSSGDSSIVYDDPLRPNF